MFVEYLLIFLFPLYVKGKAVCPSGYFGEDCKFICHCNGGHTYCQHGNCKNGCENGFIGPFCQYRAYSTLKDNSMSWIHDGDSSTCNTGTMPPLIVKPMFSTSITFMRLIFKHPGQLEKTSIVLFHGYRARKTRMTCSRKLKTQIDTAGKVFDIPCFSSKAVHSIVFDGRGVDKLCEVELSPGRNLASFLRSLPDPVIDGYTYDDKGSLSTCAKMNGFFAYIPVPLPSEINIIELHNGPDRQKNQSLFEFELERSPKNYRIFKNVDKSYKSLYRIVPQKKLINISVLQLHTDYSSYSLCEIKIIGDIQCCFKSSHLGCLNSTSKSPVCSRKEFKACEPGYEGDFCEDRPACKWGFFGFNCDQRCSSGCKQARCDPVTGDCLYCRPGLLGPKCRQECGPLTYGNGCRKKCSYHCLLNDCDKTNGTCHKGCTPGFQMPLCKEICPETYFGSNCDQRCSPGCWHGLCHHVTGLCSECHPGAQGPTCRKGCPTGKHGAKCLFSCKADCKGQKTCEMTTGLCTQCPAGKHGETCVEDCHVGKYGRGCNKFCSAYCLKGSCSTVDGSCDQGCVGNWDLPYCSRCQKTWHGQECGDKCSANCTRKECDPTSGKCYACIEGREGDYCQRFTASGITKNHLYAGLLLAALVLFILGLIGCVAKATYEDEKFQESKMVPSTPRSVISSKSGDAQSDSTDMNLEDRENDEDKSRQMSGWGSYTSGRSVTLSVYSRSSIGSNVDVEEDRESLSKEKNKSVIPIKRGPFLSVEQAAWKARNG